MTHYAYAEATCTAGGNAEYWYCAGCDGYFEDEEGENEVEFSGLILPAAGHEWMAASCDSPRRCNICGYSDGAALGHSWGDYEFSPSDCGSEGAILRVCTACGEVERIAVPVHGNAHNWGSIAVVQPSCVSAGRAVLTCADCGETVSSVIPATGAHHWDDGKITMPGCTGTGSIIHTCIDCGATETDVIPASGHVWISAGCTSPVTCAVCGATSGSALGHNWDDWTPAGDANHSRVCSRCHSVEYEEHDFGGAEYGTCTVCGHVKEHQSAGGATEIEALVEFNTNYNGYVSYGTINNKSESGYNFNTSGLLGLAYDIMPNTSNSIIFSFYSEEVLTSDMQLSVSLSNCYDVFLSIRNESDVIIEYHPVRFSLWIYNNDIQDFEVVDGMQNLSMTEVNEAIANGILNSNFSAGSQIDYTFQIRWEWAKYIEEPDSFVIYDENGNEYHFADSATNSSEWYLSVLDTAMGNVAAGIEPGVGVTYDTDGNRWTILNDSGTYSISPYSFDINVSLEPVV